VAPFLLRHSVYLRSLVRCTQQRCCLTAEHTATTTQQLPRKYFVSLAKKVNIIQYSAVPQPSTC